MQVYTGFRVTCAVLFAAYIFLAQLSERNRIYNTVHHHPYLKSVIPYFILVRVAADLEPVPGNTEYKVAEFTQDGMPVHRGAPCEHIHTRIHN